MVIGGRLSGFSLNRDGSENITITVKPGFAETYDELKDSDVTVEIKKARKHRSLEANAYAWVLIDAIAAKMGLKKTEVYRNAIKEIGGVSTTGCFLTKAVPLLRQSWEKNGLGWQVETMESKLDGCTNVILYYGSSVFDSEQMRRMIDSLIQDAEALGIPTITEQEEEKMLQRWGRKQEGKQDGNFNEGRDDHAGESSALPQAER